MPKLKSEAIERQDLVEYLQSESDFDFELSILRSLRARRLQCEHGGLYEDPVTGKAREFDIRALAKDGNSLVHLAIECKNIRSNFPLLVSRVPRTAAESFHQTILIGAGSHDVAHPFARNVRQHLLEKSVYALSEPVGKSIAQVGRLDPSGAISASDSEVFDKWSQCLASANDLVERAIRCPRPSTGTAYLAVLPILVVPDDRLWAVDYDSDGKPLGPPERVSHCSVFVGKDYIVEFGTSFQFTISHMDIMTLGGLENFSTEMLSSRMAMAALLRPES